jgi:hypothetical protein
MTDEWTLAHDVILILTGLIGFLTAYMTYKVAKLEHKLNGHIEQHHAEEEEGEKDG